MAFLDNIINAITGLGALGPIIIVGVLGVVLVLAAIPLLIRESSDPLEKLKKQNTRYENSSKKERLRRAGQNEKLAKYASFLEPQDEAELSSVRLKLIQAGYQSQDAVRAYHLAQMLLGLFGLAAGVLYFVYVKGAEGATTKDMIMHTILPGGVGYMLPKYWVTRRVEERKEEITSGFPDALDMMLVCVEAGQSLDQSILRVAEELRASYPALSEEFMIVSYELKAGKDRPKVLSDMADRAGVPDVSSFVTVLIQSSSFGTSIADALRVYAEEMRDKRVMRAEEKANKLPTKMTLATMMLTVPPLLIILIGPSIYGITEMGF